MSLTLIIIGVNLPFSAGFSNPALIQRLIPWVAGGESPRRMVATGQLRADSRRRHPPVVQHVHAVLLRQRDGAPDGAAHRSLGLRAVLRGGARRRPAQLPRAQGRRQLPQSGASGAVSAALFAFILVQTVGHHLRVRGAVPAIVHAVAYVAYSIYMERKGGDNVNHSAHLWGGFRRGFLLAVMEPLQVIGLFFDRLTHPRFGR